MKKLWITGIVLIVALGVLSSARSAPAAVYVVDTNADSGIGSLRWAITQANSNLGADAIVFNIGKCNPICTIQPLSPLPTLTDGSATIDGYTQPGSAPAAAGVAAVILVELDGSLAGVDPLVAHGLAISSTNNLVRGLAINRFAGNGIAIGYATATGNVIAGNYIGTNAAGTADLGNGCSGVFIGLGATNNTIGGTTAAQRNIISGNEWEGVGIHGAGTNGNTVIGNYIGTGVAGMGSLGNTLYGVRIYGGAQNNTVGGNASGARNVISGNEGDGVRIAGVGTNGNKILGNFIGPKVGGAAGLGNGANGIYVVNGAQSNAIGPANFIAYNTADGVAVDGSATVGNKITQNWIYSNNMGIRLTNGANGGILAPTISAVTITPGSVTIEGFACANCTVEAFANFDNDGEGVALIGSATASSGGDFTLVAGYLPWPFVTATARDVISGTSEFSGAFTAPLLAITSGPRASAILQTSATITWTTNLGSNSLVEFGRHAGEYEGQASDAALSQNHTISLTGLLPSTTYRYVVHSTDAASNTVTSRAGFFRTASPAGRPPVLSPLTVTRVEGKQELYKITAPVSDTLDVERVEFYMDGELIGIDYSAGAPPAAQLGSMSGQTVDAVAPQYESYLSPAAHKLSRSAFFGTSHTFMARAYGPSGLTDQGSVMYAPPIEFPDISLFIRTPSHDTTFYVEGSAGTLPAGTTVDVRVEAFEEEWECTWLGGGLTPPPGASDIRCGDVAHAVNRVVYKVGSTPVYTSYPSNDDDFQHEYTWDVSGLGIGTYTVRATAYANDGGSTSTDRTLTVERGAPGIEVTRDVSRVGNYFRIRLTIENEGTGTAELDNLQDNVTGFQPIITHTASYSVIPEYWVETNHADVEIDLFTDTDDTVSLAPGARMVVEYLAVPILYPDSDTFEYGIGARDEVKIWDQGGFCRWQFDRPAEFTEDGALLAESVAQAQAASDYLIITHPRHQYDQTGCRDSVNQLFSTMAELAQLKTGILGYVSNGKADSVLDTVINWGHDMKGSDGIDGHYLSNGYLLIVGEVEIIGSWESDHGLIRGIVEYTDLPYGNTSDDWVDPELIVGRVIGNSAAELMVSLQASINVYRGEGGYNFTRSSALLASGRGDGVEDFEQNVDDIAMDLGSIFSSFDHTEVIKKRVVEDDLGLNMTTVFTTSVYDSGLGRDLLFYRDHCSAFSWSGTIGTGDFPIDFGGKKPFAFAACCQAGRYEGLGRIGIAEAFMQNETPTYIGATENSDRDTNNEAAEWFFERWAQGSESVGQSFKALKRHLDRRDGDYWAAEYNMYGDPKYGADAALATAQAAARSVSLNATQSITSVDVIVPHYEVTTTVEGHQQVRIPGGGLLLEEGQPLIPVFYAEIAYPQGCQVQDVVLTNRSGLTTTTGLSLPVRIVAWDSTSPLLPSLAGKGARGLGQTGEGWWPELDQVFDWTIQKNTDGSTTLIITLYPFYYNAQTTAVQFYQDYRFDIQVISSTVELESLTTDRESYAQGDDVLIDLRLNNPGQVQDVIVSTVVKAESSGEVVDGLFLRTLQGMTGTASLSTQWNSAGFAPGYYHVEADVRDTDGNVLDQETRRFMVGVYSGLVTEFTATPAIFSIGDAISISLAFSNTGTLPITGTAVIEVHDSLGEITREFTRTLANLNPLASVAFAEEWDTTGAAKGDYTIVGYVLYNSIATELHVVSVSTVRRVYLPIVIKGG